MRVPSNATVTELQDSDEPKPDIHNVTIILFDTHTQVDTMHMFGHTSIHTALGPHSMVPGATYSPSLTSLPPSPAT